MSKTYGTLVCGVLLAAGLVAGRRVLAGDEGMWTFDNPPLQQLQQRYGFTPSPAWLEVDRDALKARVLQAPKREELVQIQLNEQLIVELYSK